VLIYLETERNVAGVAGLALLDAVETDFGFDIEIYKNIKAGSGIGSSQCSRSVYGINALLETHLKPKIWYSLPKAKNWLCNAHADNVALPFCGFTLVRSYSPLDIIK
jgi:homoserine kinase